MSVKKLLICFILSICFIPSVSVSAKETEGTIGSLGSVTVLEHNEKTLHSRCFHSDTYTKVAIVPYLCGGVITRTTTICNICRKIVREASSIRIGADHTYNGGTVLKESTGIKVRYTCTVCGYTRDVNKQISTVKIREVRSGKKGTIAVTVVKVSGVTGYQVQISKEKNFKKAVLKYMKKEKITLNMKRGEKYYIRVRGYMDIGNSRLLGRWSKVKSTTVK